MLLDAVPRIDQPNKPGRPMLGAAPALDVAPILTADELKVHFPINVGGGIFGKMKPLKAVDGVSFDLRPGETLGVVGESGCGKSTLARAVLKLVPQTSGTVAWMGRDISQADRTTMNACAMICRLYFKTPWLASTRA
jgi:peptide/nickel transport system ATP-binding protein